MKEDNEALSSILAITPTLIMVGLISSILRGLSGVVHIVVKAPTVDEFEVWMSQLWKSYGRKQPKRYFSV